MYKFLQRYNSIIKFSSSIIAFAGAVMLTLGDILWLIGLILFISGLCIRIFISLTTQSAIVQSVINQHEYSEKIRDSRSAIQDNPITVFPTAQVNIKVVGLGGGGSNSVTRMVESGIRGVQFIAMNTDAQALAYCKAPTRLQIGMKLTMGLGVGGDPELGRKAAEENREAISEIISGADMVFVAAGMGGGTGTGSAPIVADIAKKSGALTIAVVTKPFLFEGVHRTLVAEEGILRLFEYVDTLIIVPNDRLLALCDPRTSVDSAFQLADDILSQGVRAITEVITVRGLINVDFADIKTIMKDSGPAWLSVGIGSGQNRAADAARAALASPLLDVSIQNSKKVLFYITGGSTLTLFEVNEAAEIISKAAHPSAEIMFGVAQDSTLENTIHITVIASGFVTEVDKTDVSEEEQIAKLIKGLDVESHSAMDSLLQRRRAIN